MPNNFKDMYLIHGTLSFIFWKQLMALDFRIFYFQFIDKY